MTVLAQNQKVSWADVPVEQVDSPAEVVVEVPAEVAVESEAEAPSEVGTIESQLSVVRSELSKHVKDLSEKLKDLRLLDVELKKISVSAKKNFKRKVKKTGSKSSDSGFNAHVLISDELADFLQVERGISMRPPQVFSKLNSYAKENNCKDEKNKAIFICDDKMKKLLGEPEFLIKKSEPSLGYGISNFNINKYLNKHYTKISKSA